MVVAYADGYLINFYMFKANRYPSLSREVHIEEIVVERITEKHVFFNNGQCAPRFSEFCAFFETFNEAKSWLVKYKEFEISQLIMQLNSRRRELDALKKLRQ